MNYRPNPLLYGANKAFSGTFKLVVTMRDTVDHPLLLDAVHAAMKRYPYFCVTPQKDGNRIQLHYNEAPVPVFDDGRCVVLGTEESNGHLLAFGCEERRILLHASHYIADGMGIAPLLMTVMYLYISKKYGTDGLHAERIPQPSDPVSEEEYAYPFPEEPRKPDTVQTEKTNSDAAYLLDDTAFDKQGLYAYHLRIPQIAMMDVATPSDGSPVSFLSVMMFRALCALDPKIDRTVIAHVQHQYREVLHTPLNRHSLVSYIPVKLPPRIKDRSVELQNTMIRGQVILGSEPEKDLCAVDRLVAVLSKDPSADLSEKQLAMRHYIENSIRPKTFGISYMGKLSWCGMDRYIEDLHAYIGEKSTPHMLLIEVMTVGDCFSVNVMQSGRGRRYIDAFITQLRDFGIPVSLVGEERYTLCDTAFPWEY